ncbi:MAG TPA: glycerophosphodiester phosphodiesterase family protein [Anaeromyxobacteraceae bacterium]|nr:glycerophosphodiester phosphodiesterase family protein [Anaeromyxobacteraceae bacterium]
MTFPTVPAPRAPGRPLVLGHRGASAEAPENTLAAFRLAMAQGADGVELDAWRCATGEVVVIHDEETGRTSDGTLAVPDSPLAALRALDAGAWKGERYRGERIPLLAEVLEALPGAVVNVELKARPGRPDPALAAEVARVVREARAAERVIVSSFDFGLVAALRQAAPALATGLLFEAGLSWRLRVPLAAARLAPSALHPDVRLCTGARLSRWVAAGRAVNVWTVDAPDEVARLAQGGAAALIANAPGAARQAVRRATGR